MQKIRLLVFGLLAGMMASSAYVQEINLPEGFTVAGSSGAYKLVLTPYATYPLIYEEVVPEVSSETVNYTAKEILRGKWGTGPAEFGRVIDISILEQPGPDDIIGHVGPAINSLNELYILDKVNNRIEKFDQYGNYLKSIRVLSMANKKGDSVITVTNSSTAWEGKFKMAEDNYYDGMGLTFDSEDNLYYYIRKKDFNEVLIFKNDKIYKKIKGPKNFENTFPAGIIIINGNLYSPIVDLTGKNSHKLYDYHKKRYINGNYIARSLEFLNVFIHVPNNTRNTFFLKENNTIKKIVLPENSKYDLDIDNFAIESDGNICVNLVLENIGVSGSAVFLMENGGTIIKRITGKCSCDKYYWENDSEGTTLLEYKNDEKN